MTSILDEMDKYREEKLLQSQKLANSSFLDSISKVRSIADTPGYKMIKSFWQKELNDSIDKIDLIDASKSAIIAKEQARLGLAKKFLQFLNSYEDPLIEKEIRIATKKTTKKVTKKT